MTESVDLTNLREMTGGDKDLERELFQEFFSSSQKLLDQLHEALTSDNLEAWRAGAHALKGTAYNLGATPLGDLCKKAQENFDTLGEDKKELLKLMRDAYAQTKVFLERELASF